MASFAVGPSATGSGNGSDWNNIAQYSSISFSRGNDYYLQDGTYGTKTLQTLESGTSVIRLIKATESAHGPATGWTSGMGDGTANIGTLLIMTNYWVIDGVNGGGPDNWTSGHGIVIAGGSIQINPSFNPVHVWQDGFGSHIELRHIEIDGTGTTGTEAAIGFAWAEDLVVAYCWTHDSAECFLNSLDASDVIIEYSCIGDFCMDCSPSIHGEIASWKFSSGDFTFRYNLCLDAGANGSGGVTGGLLMLNAPGRSANVYGNIFYRPIGVTWSAGGDGLIGPWTNFDDDNLSNCRVYNNTFVRCSYLCAGLVGSTPHDGLEWKNNYFYDSVTGLPNGAWDHNYNQYQDSGSESEPNGTTGTGDPFVDFQNLNFRLDANTVAGEDLGAPYNIDMYGNTRSTWTRGAIEFNGSPPAGGTLTSTGTMTFTSLTVG